MDDKNVKKDYHDEGIVFTSYPEGYNQALKHLDFLPEDQRAAYLDGFVTWIIM